MDSTPFRDLPGHRERLVAIRLRIILAESELRAARQSLQDYLADKRRYDAERELKETDEIPQMRLIDDTKF